MTSMETFIIGAAGGALAAFVIGRANKMTVDLQSTEAALLSHDAAIGALVQQASLPTCNCKISPTGNGPQTGGQYL